MRLHGAGKGNSRQDSGNMRMPRSNDPPGPVIVRPMTEEERQRYGVPASQVVSADEAQNDPETDGYHLDPSVREAIKQDLLAFVGRRTIQEKYHVPAQLVSYYATQLQRTGQLPSPSGHSRPRRTTTAERTNPKEDETVMREKISDEVIIGICTDLHEGQLNRTQIAEKYGVSPFTVTKYAKEQGEGLLLKEKLEESTTSVTVSNRGLPKEGPTTMVSALLDDMIASLVVEHERKAQDYVDAKDRLRAAHLLRDYMQRDPNLSSEEV